MVSKKKRLLVVVLGFLLVLGILTFFGEKGVFHLLRLKRELMRIEEANKQMEMENKRLREEVMRLKSEKGYLEEIARRELGMVKEGEIIYHFDTQKGEREISK